MCAFFNGKKNEDEEEHDLRQICQNRMNIVEIV